MVYEQVIIIEIGFPPTNVEVVIPHPKVNMTLLIMSELNMTIFKIS